MVKTLCGPVSSAAAANGMAPSSRPMVSTRTSRRALGSSVCRTSSESVEGASWVGRTEAEREIEASRKRAVVADHDAYAVPSEIPD